MRVCLISAKVKMIENTVRFHYGHGATSIFASLCSCILAFLHLGFLYLRSLRNVLRTGSLIRIFTSDFGMALLARLKSGMQVCRKSMHSKIMKGQLRQRGTTVLEILLFRFSGTTQVTWANRQPIRGIPSSVRNTSNSPSCVNSKPNELRGCSP